MGDRHGPTMHCRAVLTLTVNSRLTRWRGYKIRNTSGRLNTTID
jgi:hypothetical protein